MTHVPIKNISRGFFIKSNTLIRLFLFLFAVYVHVCMCMYMYMGVLACAWMSGGQRSVTGVFLYPFSILVFETRLHTEFRVHHFSQTIWPASSNVSLLLQNWGYRGVPPCPAFLWTPKLQSRILTCTRTLYPLSHPPASGSQLKQEISK